MTIKFAPFDSTRDFGTSNAIIILSYEGEPLSDRMKKLLDENGLHIDPNLFVASGYTGAKGQDYQQWVGDGRRFIFVGLGKPVDPDHRYSVEATQSMGGLAAKIIKKWKIKDAAVVLEDFSSHYDVCLGLLLGDYGFSRKSRKPEPIECTTTVFSASLVAENTGVYMFGFVVVDVAEAICMARDLVSDGANTVHPGEMLARARQIAALNPRQITCKNFNMNQLSAMGANLIVAVGSGSKGHQDREPRLVHMTYRPLNSEGEKLSEIWLIGKGVTFDSGGINLKPYEGMRHMRTDMGGAAACLGVMQLLAKHGCGVIVHCLMPLVENMTGPLAYKVGDIYTSLSGRTVEIVHTDAEGRLILADAATYAQTNGAKKIVEIATLTGGQIIALGPMAALYANKAACDSRLRYRMLQASEFTGEAVWQMPLDPRLKSLLESRHGADIANYSGTTQCGAATGALFVDSFIDPGVEFLHLDIAGPSFSTLPLGLHHIPDNTGTGFGVALLHNFLSRLEDAK